MNGEKYRSVDVKTPIRGTRVVTIELADDISKELPPRNDMGVSSDNFTRFGCLLPSRTDDDFVIAVEVGWKASDCPAAAVRRKIRKEESFIITGVLIHKESPSNQIKVQAINASLHKDKDKRQRSFFLQNKKLKSNTRRFKVLIPTSR